MWKYFGTSVKGPGGEKIARQSAGQPDPDAPCVELSGEGMFAIWVAPPLLRVRDYPELRHEPLDPKCPYAVARERTPEQQQILMLEKALATAEMRTVQAQASATALGNDLAEERKRSAAMAEVLKKTKPQ